MRDLKQQVTDAFMEAYVNGEDPWPAAFTVFGEALLSGEAIDAAARAMCLPSWWLSADDVTREAVRSDARIGLRAALDEVLAKDRA